MKGQGLRQVTPSGFFTRLLEQRRQASLANKAERQEKRAKRAAQWATLSGQGTQEAYRRRIGGWYKERKRSVFP